MAATIPNSIRQQVNVASALIARIVKDDLITVHLHGSAAEDGLKPQSDIDLLVTIRQPLNTRQREDLTQGFLEISAPPGSIDSYRALEMTIVVSSQFVPRRFPPSGEMRFDEWLRDGIHVGIVEPRQMDPDLSILLTQTRRASVALFGEPAKMLFNVIPFSDVMQTFRHILDMWQKPGGLEGDERNIILTLARIWYSVVTGSIVAKDGAASWLIPQLPDKYVDTLQATRTKYLGLTRKSWAASTPFVERSVSYAKKQIADRLE